MTEHFPVLPCPACARMLLIGEGAVNRMEVALDRDGQSAVLLDMERMAQTRKGERQLADLQQVLTDFLHRPERLRDTEINDLNEFWELKATKVRLPFIGATCPGTTSSSGLQRHLVLPALVHPADPAHRTARAVLVFLKGTQKTPRKVLDKLKAIHREDATR